MRKVSIYYFDDEQYADPFTSSEHYKERLENSANIDCKVFPPPKELEELDQLLDPPPDLFLLDYLLSAVQPNGYKVGYKGSTLAAEIRSRLPNIPIVLMTQEAILNTLEESRKRQLLDNMPSFDELILKSQLESNLTKIQHDLVILAQGFSELRNSEKTWKSLIRLLGASDAEESLLVETSSPMENRTWIVTDAADWIRNTVLAFPGILYDSLYAATLLGISKDAFQNENLQEMLKPASYTGLFVPIEERWWKQRLMKSAQELLVEQEMNGPVNRVFAEAFAKKFDARLPLAICTWDKMPVADWVCHIRQEPVKIKNSLRYYPDKRPSVMDAARVSFKAIQQNYVDKNLFDSDSQDLLKDIEDLPEPSEP